MAGSIPNNGTNTKNYSLRNGLQWYWDLSSADATITDQHSGLVLTRSGTVNTLANGAPDGGSCIDFPTGGTANFYRNASVRPLDSYSESYSVNGNNGVAFSLGNIQKTDDGPRMDGRLSAADEFSAEARPSANISDLDDLI